MKILIVPDSFKGTLTSKEVCSAITQGLNSLKNAEITSIPFADGGEGFAECLSSICNGKILYSKCTDLYGNPMNGHFFTYDKTAIIECATASGIQPNNNVMKASSYGTGELIKSAVKRGFSNIILGLGGSGCCDGGAGALAALGAEFKNIYGEIISYPTGENIEKIASINFSNIVKYINFTYACDVNNVFYGVNGAAYVFAKQKGATDKDIIRLDNGLKKINSLLPSDVSQTAGTGAAGGLCAGLYGVYGGKIESGFDIVANACNLDDKIRNCDIVITGEGKTDFQTLMGKLPFKIAEKAKKYDKKCIVISGIIDGVKLGSHMISLVDQTTTAKYAMENAYETLVHKSKNILHLI